MPLRIVQLNAVYDVDATDADALLDRYTTLTDWASALQHAEADVMVVQRFRQSAEVRRGSVPYVLLDDGGPAFPEPSWSASALTGAVAGLRPDVVHVNGLMFPGLAAALRSVLPATTTLIAQDHAGFEPPRTWPGGWRSRRARLWREGCGALDAWSFTSAAQAEPWRAAGWLRDAPVLEIPESSTTLEPMPRGEARRESGVEGSPSIVWIGRLDANKDPLTVVEALETVFEHRPAARAWMIYHAAPLESEVRARIEQAGLTGRVTLVGRVNHDRVAAYLSAADLFVSGSHKEGSGYALIEAMACGAVPVVTDIPSFGAIAGECGYRWTPGERASCASALLHAAEADLATARDQVVARFARELSWTAIGRRTVDLYGELFARRAGTGR